MSKPRSSVSLRPVNSVGPLKISPSPASIYQFCRTNGSLRSPYGARMGGLSGHQAAMLLSGKNNAAPSLFVGEVDDVHRKSVVSGAVGCAIAKSI